jgi:hypothetical protein
MLLAAFILILLFVLLGAAVSHVLFWLVIIGVIVLIVALASGRRV